MVYIFTGMTRARYALLCVLLGLAWATARGEEVESPAEVARREYERVMGLAPSLDNGRRIFLICAVCHGPEGWGSKDGTYPQIAGQLRSVIVKQLADIRARNRDNPLMYPFSVPEVLGGPQSIADVAAYVAQLPMTAENGKGPGDNLEKGAELYREHCRRCHGDEGFGIASEHLPQIASQHYMYLVRQFDAIRSGRRKNSDSRMVKQIESISPDQEVAILDYTSRLAPPADKLARAGWINPDFPDYLRPRESTAPGEFGIEPPSPEERRSNP